MASKLVLLCLLVLPCAAVAAISSDQDAQCDSTDTSQQCDSTDTSQDEIFMIQQTKMSKMDRKMTKMSMIQKSKKLAKMDRKMNGHSITVGTKTTKGTTKDTTKDTTKAGKSEIPCADLYEDSANDKCRSHVLWAYEHGKHSEWASGWYWKMNDVAGVSIANARLADFHRYFYCTGSGDYKCGTPACYGCTYEPCCTCSLDAAAESDTATCKAFDYSATEYVPGKPGGPWTREEAILVKAKLYRIFSSGGGNAVMTALKVTAYDWRSAPNAPKFLRMGFHDCAKYKDGSGGCDGCLHWDGVGKRYGDEEIKKLKVPPATNADGGHNNGLGPTIMTIEELYTNRNFPDWAPPLNMSLKQSGKSRADLIAFAAMIAVQYGVEANNLYCDTPESKKLFDTIGFQCQYGVGESYCKVDFEDLMTKAFQTGRIDCETDEDKPYKAPQQKYESFPDALGNGLKTINFFKKEYNLTARETVAVMGAHTFGRVHGSHSLFHYGWTSGNALLFNNHYWRTMVKKPEWFFIWDWKNQKCIKHGNAYGQKAKGRFVPHAWMSLTNGGPVQWINEKYVCSTCIYGNDKNDPEWKKCCENKPAALSCLPDNSTSTACAILSDPANAKCNPHVSWAYEHGKHSQWASDWWGKMNDVAGVSIANATLEDFQRYFYCTGSGDYKCGTPPCNCSSPPCTCPDDVNSGCEKFSFISGEDETMLTSEMGLYLNFSVDKDGAPYGCPNFENFNSANWVQGKNVFTTFKGANGWGAKAEPACPLNNFAEGGDVALHKIIQGYADDAQKFIRDFVPSLKKMLANGYAEGNLTDGPDVWTNVSCPVGTWDRWTTYSCLDLAVP